MRGVRLAGKIFRGIITLLLALLLAANVYNIVMRRVFKVKQPSVLGFSSAVVLSGSMEPEISVDDMVIIRRESSYQPGDIIMYEGEHSAVTHRVVRIDDGAYITRGDANNADDPATPPEKVVGKVVMVVPGIGKIIGFMQSPFGMCVLILAAAAMLILPDMLKRGRKRGGAD